MGPGPGQDGPAILEVLEQPAVSIRFQTEASVVFSAGSLVLDLAFAGLQKTHL